MFARHGHSGIDAMAATLRRALAVGRLFIGRAVRAGRPGRAGRPPGQGFELPPGVTIGDDLARRLAGGAAGSRHVPEGVVPVPSEHAGVLLTEHPDTSGAMRVERVAGRGEDPPGQPPPGTGGASGAYRFGRLTGALQAEGGNGDPVAPPLDLHPLLALGRELEALFGTPQEIEWASADGHFHLLRSSDIARPVTVGDTLLARAERERARLLAELVGRRRHLRLRAGEATDAPLLLRDTLPALPPRPTPLSVDLVRRLGKAGGATDLACRELGVPYEVHARSVPSVTTLFGWTYLNRAERARRTGRGPGTMAGLRLARDAEAMRTAFEQDFLPAFRDRMVERHAIVPKRLSLEGAAALFADWIERFESDTCVQTERIGIAADVHTGRAHDGLVAASLDPIRYLAARGDSIDEQAMALLADAEPGPDAVNAFLLVFGHRAPLDHELSAPRFDEDDTPSALRGQRPADGVERPSPDDGAELDSRPGLREAVERAREFRTLAQDARHHGLIELAQIRRLLLAIDRLAGLDGHIFQLEVDEIRDLHDAARRADLVAVARMRFDDAQAWSALLPPASLSLLALERLDLTGGEASGQRRPDEPNAAVEHRRSAA